MQSDLSQEYTDPETGQRCPGLVCNLFTGPLSIKYENATHTSAVIEVANFDEEYDVAVIDEIQMI